MKKAALLLLAVVIFGLGLAFSQPPATDTHGATVVIPSGGIRIRFTLGSSNTNVPNPDSVDFVFTPATFTAGTFSPTNPSFNWDDIRVHSNSNAGWQVVVFTTGSATFDWSKIEMTPTGAGVSYYDLGSTFMIADEKGKTGGWRRLGIDPEDYVLTLDGTEDPGTYTATVVFTLQTP